MTDIVERLRKNTVCIGHGDYRADPLCVEAADTIERLRAECNNLYKKLNDINDILQEIAVSEENYKSENARLRDIVCKYLDGSMREKDIRAAAAAIRDSRNCAPEGANDE